MTYTLDDARADLRERMDDGWPCPCCGQLAKIYRRKIHAGIVRDLFRFGRHAGADWCHAPSVLLQGSGEFAKLAHWRLVEEDSSRRDDGGRAGWWRITARGATYMRGELAVQKYARIYNGHCLGLEGELVTIRDALGARFDFSDLMAGL